MYRSSVRPAPGPASARRRRSAATVRPTRRPVTQRPPRAPAAVSPVLPPWPPSLSPGYAGGADGGPGLAGGQRRKQCQQTGESQERTAILPVSPFATGRPAHRKRERTSTYEEKLWAYVIPAAILKSPLICRAVSKSGETEGLFAECPIEGIAATVIVDDFVSDGSGFHVLRISLPVELLRREWRDHSLSTDMTRPSTINSTLANET